MNDDLPYTADDYYLDCEKDEARREQVERQRQRQRQDNDHNGHKVN